jgi:hypothetical protein
MADFKMDEEAWEAATHVKRERERWLKNHHEERRCWLDDWEKRLVGEEEKLKDHKRVHKKLHEEERLRMRERSAPANAAKERGDKTRKWPRWTHDHSIPELVMYLNFS